MKQCFYTYLTSDMTKNFFPINSTFTNAKIGNKS